MGEVGDARSLERDATPRVERRSILEVNLALKARRPHESMQEHEEGVYELVLRRMVPFMGIVILADVGAPLEIVEDPLEAVAVVAYRLGYPRTGEPLSFLGKHRQHLAIYW